MLKAFQKFVAEQKLFFPHQNILLAVSGGIDSVALVHLFSKSKFNFAIAHCNFSLRGSESDEDQLFVEKLAKMHQVPFYTATFDTKLEAENRKVSIQMAARDLRYEWFSTLLNQYDFDFLATAHHANDSLETALINLTRGTGIAGLHGIPVVSKQIIRPLLFATRKEIANYADENKLLWREDSSNNSDKYARNLIRHKVIPVLQELNPNLEQTFLHSSTRLKQIEEAFIFNLCKERKKFETEEDGVVKLDIRKILALPEGFLFEILIGYSFLYDQIIAIWKIISAPSYQPGKSFLSLSHILIIDRTHLIITNSTSKEAVSIFISASENEIRIGDETLKISKIQASEFAISSSPKITALDFDKLHFPLLLRTWQQGDSFIPLGMKGKKKLSDFLVDNKIPLNLKSKIKVLVSDNEIAWVVGMRISNMFKISPQTSTIMSIELCK